MIDRARLGLSIFLMALVAASPVLAFEDPLSSSAIRDAYMLGSRNDFTTAEFFAPYTHSLPMPDAGPHVAFVSIETPYGQVVELGEAAMNTDIQGTEQRLENKTFPFIVRVEVDLTDSYPGPPPSSSRAAAGIPIPDFERDFDIRLVQKHKTIPLRSKEVSLLYSGSTATTVQLSGAIIELRYDTAAIDSYDDASVTVHTPEGQNIETSFDLGHLK